MENVARVVLALTQHEVAEQVMHYLDRTGRVRIVATATDERQLDEAVRQTEPDAVVASPGLRTRGTGPLLAVSPRETVQALRASIGAGATGFFVWPDDREALAGAAARVRSGTAREDAGSPGTVLAVLGARGGAGVTFLATHLAAEQAEAGRRCLLVEADPVGADLTVALGVPGPPAPQSLGDLLPLVEEIRPEHAADLAWRHAAGFGALLAPEPDLALRIDAGQLRAIGWAAAHAAEVTLMHLGRDLGGLRQAALEHADRVLLVTTLDVAAFRSGRRAVQALGELGFRGRVDVVVNRARRADLVPTDVEAAFGCAPLGVIPSDAAVTGAQDRGALLPRRSRARRAVGRLAAALSDDLDRPDAAGVGSGPGGHVIERVEVRS